MNKNIWLDLEIKKDIDDYITLVYALEKKLNIKVVSLRNPSKLEIDLVFKTINEYDRSIELIINGNINDHSEDVHKSLKLIPFKTNKKSSYKYIYQYLENITDLSDFTIFCGGDLNTLSILTDLYDCNTFNACIQGGFASYKIVGKENTLKKFKGRVAVPTWNLNLDILSTNKILKSNLKCNFVSKNICHNSFVSKNDLSNNNNLFTLVIKNFLDNNEYPNKCMHDMLALMTIDNKELVKFENVNLFHTDTLIPKWWCELNKDSNFKISISCDFSLFYNIIKKI